MIERYTFKCQFKKSPKYILHTYKFRFVHASFKNKLRRHMLVVPFSKIGQSNLDFTIVSPDDHSKSAKHQVVLISQRPLGDHYFILTNCQLTTNLFIILYLFNYNKEKCYQSIHYIFVGLREAKPSV